MKDRLVAQLEPYGQQHVAAFWDELAADERQHLAEQVDGIDLVEIRDLFARREVHEDWSGLADRMDSPPAIRLGGQSNPFTPEQARQRGAEALRAGEVGVILVAGGQGTRLGFDHPKGMFPIGPVSGASLFQILIEKVVASSRRYGVRIPVYLMTSPATHEETVEYLAARERFGLPPGDLRIFCQGTMPAVDAQTGRLLLAERGRLFASPDGHGGLVRALARSGSLDDMRRRGIRCLSYFQIDNPLAAVCDPEFVGDHVLSGSEYTLQVVAKRTPQDRLGNVVAVDGKLRIIEYSDLPEAIGNLRNPDGSLAVWAGSIAVHMLDVGLLERMSRDGGRLPFHIARKKVPYIDPSGKLVEPKEPNAIKFEQFIFDLLPAARRGVVVEVDPAKAFAPLKNAPGAAEDTAESVRAQMVALAAEWLRAAGAVVEPGLPVEISPLFALDAEELAGKIEPGLDVRKARYFR
jgi:UDP-N-acetylglucosamine/UDP-N-acetylgalactosamine diphosphorylase